MTAPRQAIGQWGENRAAEFLAQNGYTLLQRNVRTPYGEIDLIAQTGDTLVFVEVKTRASSSLGPPEISVTPRKREHFLAAIQAYLQAHPQAPPLWRVDVIAIQKRPPPQPPEIIHFENAFS